MQVPSVTQVLSSFQNFSRVCPDVLAHAAERGTTVHRLCAAYAQGLPLFRVDPEAAGYFASFQYWFDSVVEGVFAVEERMEDPDLGFTGQPDLVCLLRGDSSPSLWDYKTPVQQARIWRGQMAAYRKLAVGRYPGLHRQASLQLDPNGKAPRVREYTGTYERDLAAFIAALTAHKYFRWQ